jgi:hypothetical protein
MAFSDSAILEAIAAHYDAKTPPTGETLRFVSAYPVESLGAVPAVVLYEGSDAVAYGAGNRSITLTVNAVLYLPLVEYARSYKRISVWREWMRDSLLDAVLLNSTNGVAQASIASTSTDTSDFSDAPVITITATIEIAGVEAIAPSA